MELLIDEITTAFLSFLWPMIRISALLITAPLFSLGAVTLRIRVLLALALTLMIYPLHDWPLIDPFTASGLREVFLQAIIGGMMGLTLQIVAAAVVVAGQSISAPMGLSMANMIDPNLGNVPVISQFLQILSTLLFLSLGGHLILLAVLLDSFHTVPIGILPDIEFLYRMLVQWSAIIFLGGMLIALPVVGMMLLIQVGMGIITRAAPSLNIFAVGFPMLLILGLTFLYITMVIMLTRIENLWLLGFLRAREMMGLG